jgi:hypothetical protein
MAFNDTSGFQNPFGAVAASLLQQGKTSYEIADAIRAMGGSNSDIKAAMGELEGLDTTDTTDTTDNLAPLDQPNQPQQGLLSKTVADLTRGSDLTPPTSPPPTTVADLANEPTYSPEAAITRGTTAAPPEPVLPISQNPARPGTGLSASGDPSFVSRLLDLSSGNISPGEAEVPPGGDTLKADQPGFLDKLKNTIGIGKGAEQGVLGKTLDTLGSPELMQGLIGAGLGMMGAQGTYGNVGAAIGKGGLVGLAAYDEAARQAQKDRALQQKAASDLNAQNLKQAEAQLKLVPDLLKSRNPKNIAAANTIIGSPLVQTYFKALGPGVVLGGDLDKPSIIHDGPTGQIVLADPNSREVTQIGQMRPEPRNPPPAETEFRVLKNDPRQSWYDKNLPENADVEVLISKRGGAPIAVYGLAGGKGGDGSYTITRVNNPKLPGFSYAYPVDQNVLVRFDKDHPEGQVVGMAPEKGGLEVTTTTSPTGETSTTTTTGGTGKAGLGPAASKAYETIQNIDAMDRTSKMMRENLSQMNVGILGQLRTMKYGMLGQARGLAGATGLVNIVENNRKSAEKEEKDPYARTYLSDPSLSAEEMLSRALVFQYARSLHGVGRLNKDSLNAARTALGVGGWFSSAPDIDNRLTIFDQVNADSREEAQKTIDAANARNPLVFLKPPGGTPGSAPVGRITLPAGGAPTGRMTKDEFFNSLGGGR